MDSLHHVSGRSSDYDWSIFRPSRFLVSACLYSDLEATQLQVITDFGVTREICWAHQITYLLGLSNMHKSQLPFIQIGCVNHTCSGNASGALELSAPLRVSDLYKTVDAFAPCLTLSCGFKHNEAHLRCLFFSRLLLWENQPREQAMIQQPQTSVITTSHLLAASVSTQCRFSVFQKYPSARYGALPREAWELLVRFKTLLRDEHFNITPVFIRAFCLLLQIALFGGGS